MSAILNICQPHVMDIAKYMKYSLQIISEWIYNVRYTDNNASLMLILDFAQNICHTFLRNYQLLSCEKKSRNLSLQYLQYFIRTLVPRTFLKLVATRRFVECM